MKKLIIAAVLIAVLLFALPVSATEVETGIETEVISEDTAEIETTVAVDVEIGEELSFSETVLAIADKLGISVEEAEDLVQSIREFGDEYFSDTDLWSRVTADMDAHPAKWTIFGLLAALVLFLIGLLIKRVISDATTLSRLKVAVAGIDRALSGDGQGDTQGEPSIRALINGNNERLEEFKREHGEQLELLKGENAALAARNEELTQTVRGLNEVIRKMESNSDTSLKITEESALQILQLLNLALDRKVPVTTKEARALWYSATQNKIKSIYEEGVDNVNGGTEKAGEKV